jgi:hypothetical protein
MNESLYIQWKQFETEFNDYTRRKNAVERFGYDNTND